MRRSILSIILIVLLSGIVTACGVKKTPDRYYRYNISVDSTAAGSLPVAAVTPSSVTVFAELPKREIAVYAPDIAPDTITDTIAEPEDILPPTEDEPHIETVSVPNGTPTSLGEFRVTAYCECRKCNGKWTGHKLNTPTQGGSRYPIAGYTISVDPNVIPLRSVVELEGLGARYAQDTGSAIKGNRIDLFLASHEEALEFGVKMLEVWIYS
ncbi:MAG: 3D domain-containing protein [Oscillospiraceae bacterium]|nr:3D domain-containing protein [Oscillospiraceae bacterium]